MFVIKNSLLPSMYREQRVHPRGLSQGRAALPQDAAPSRSACMLLPHGAGDAQLRTFRYRRYPIKYQIRVLSRQVEACHWR
jgi:hypothetical protein